MKSSLDHLPETKRRELARVVEILFAEFEEARGAYEVAYDIFLRKLGPDHTNTKTVAANIAAFGNLGWF